MRTYYEHNHVRHAANAAAWELVEFEPGKPGKHSPDDPAYIVRESDLTPEQCERLRLACAGLATREG